MKYKTKDLEVEAVKWVGDNTDEIQEFLGDEYKCYADGDNLCMEKGACVATIPIGWYVTKEANGNRHFFSAEKFRMIFERVKA